MCVVIVNKNKQPVEIFMFEIHTLCSGLNVVDPYLITTEQSLRALLLKLQMCNNNLTPLPKICMFSVHIHTTESASLSLTDDPERQDDFSLDSSPNIESGMVVPVNDINTKYLRLEVFVVESNKK